jgi:putative GTP pyrophosphokinase
MKEESVMQVGFTNEQMEKFIRDNLFSDEVIDSISENMMPIESLMAYYRCAIMEVETKFKVLDEQFSLQYDRNPIESIKSRIKSMEGIIKKVRRKNVPLSLEAIEKEIKDIAGIRVVCSFPEDIYLLADCFLQQDDIRLIEMKDYIKNPKESGYRSLHLIVEVPIFLEHEKKMMKVEIQIRSLAMDFWASQEHKLRYKKNIPEDERERLAVELKEIAEEVAAIDGRMSEIRARINSPEYQEKVNASKRNLVFPFPGPIAREILDSIEAEEAEEEEVEEGE